MARAVWSDEELILAGDLADDLGWRGVGRSSPGIAELSALLRRARYFPPDERDDNFRSVNSVAMKLNNLKAAHPSHQGIGLRNTSREKVIVDMFVTDHTRMKRVASEIRERIHSATARLGDANQLLSLVEGRPSPSGSQSGPKPADREELIPPLHSDDSNGSNFWERISTLWAVATGGPEVAARPNADPSPLPRAPSVPGLDEARDWFAGALNSEVNNYLFLVGGPGAGKSRITSDLVREYNLVSDLNPQLAHRTYEYEASGRRVLLVNDATMPSVYEETPLVHEIDDADSSRSHLIACVNRGILVEEDKGIAQMDTYTPGSELICWLLGKEQGFDDVRVETDLDESYLKTGRLVYDGVHVADVVVVYVDVCSLFEERPIASYSRDLGWTAGRYEIASQLARESWTDEATVAGSLLALTLEYLGPIPTDDPDTNPLLANLQDLSSPSIRRNWLWTLRGAEIVSGQKLTYRELWGAVVRSIAGDLPSVIDRTEVREHLDSLMNQARDGGIKSFQSIRTLAGLRIHEALFANIDSFGVEGARDPVVDRLALVDPMRDAVPGDGSGSTQEGWFTPVSGAVSGIADGQTPLPILRNAANGSTDAATDQAFRRKFDEWLEAWAVDQLQGTVAHKFAREPVQLQAWYAGYLGRLYALHVGVRAFSKETRLWMQACQVSPAIPIELESGLDTLIRPHREPGNKQSATMIPVFDSRAAPIIGPIDGFKIATELEGFKMTTELRGESLELLLRESNDVQARVVLDFALVREALAAGEGEPGITEVSETTVPRLERFRSSQLIPGRLKTKDYRLVSQHGAEQILVQRGQ